MPIERPCCSSWFRALVEIRQLAWMGMAQRAADLADAIHNIPAYLDSDQFDVEVAKGFVVAYYKKYPRPLDGTLFDYLAFFQSESQDESKQT